MSLTTPQREVLDLVTLGHGGKLLDIDQLQASLGRSSTKQALQCAIRILEGKGYLSRSYETRRGRKRMVLVPLAAAFRVLGAPLPPLPSPTP